MKTLSDFEFRNQRVLVRCDFNVPLDEKGEILDDFKIVQALPTIHWLLEKQAKIILMSHLGDPGGEPQAKLQLRPVKKCLEKYLSFPIVPIKDYFGSRSQEAINLLSGREVILLENLRFHPEEEKGDLNFARSLAGLADIYVNDAFAVCHRSHASLLVPNFLPSATGLLLEKEVTVLGRLRDNPRLPLVVILGGQAKGLEAKLKLINLFSQKASFVLLGGLVSQAIEDQGLSFEFPQKIVLALDAPGALDAGPETLTIFQEKIAAAETVFWSGPLGRIEEKDFCQGSLALANAIIDSRAFSVVGGGETAWFLKKEGLLSKFSHVSTGGDAMLLFLSGEKLPGIEALAKGMN